MVRNGVPQVDSDGGKGVKDVGRLHARHLLAEVGHLEDVPLVDPVQLGAPRSRVAEHGENLSEEDSWK